MHELKFKLCPRWLGWTLVLVGYALFGGAVWAWSAAREGLALTLLVVGGIYVVVLVLVAVVAILVRRPWRADRQEKQ